MVAIEEKLHQFYSWLAAPHLTDFEREAQKLRQSNTGRWFTEGDELTQWKLTDSSILWLCGIRKLIRFASLEYRN
jgi:hypothetical protein